MCEIGKIVRVTNEGEPETAEQILEKIRPLVPAEQVVVLPEREKVPVRVRRVEQK